MAEKPRRRVHHRGGSVRRLLAHDDAELLEEGNEVHILPEEDAALLRAPAAHREGGALTRGGGRRRRTLGAQHFGARLEDQQLGDGNVGAEGQSLQLLPQERRMLSDGLRIGLRGGNHRVARRARLAAHVADPRLEVPVDERREHLAYLLAHGAPGAARADEGQDIGSHAGAEPSVGPRPRQSAPARRKIFLLP
jgi:hypothetical protein